MISYLKTFFILYLFTVTLLDFFENNIYAKENIFIENAYIPIFYEKQLSAAGYFSLKNNHFDHYILYYGKRNTLSYL